MFGLRLNTSLGSKRIPVVELRAKLGSKEKGFRFAGFVLRQPATTLRFVRPTMHPEPKPHAQSPEPSSYPTITSSMSKLDLTRYSLGVACALKSRDMTCSSIFRYRVEFLSSYSRYSEAEVLVKGIGSCLASTIRGVTRRDRKHVPTNVSYSGFLEFTYPY